MMNDEEVGRAAELGTHSPLNYDSEDEDEKNDFGPDYTVEMMKKDSDDDDDDEQLPSTFDGIPPPPPPPPPSRPLSIYRLERRLTESSRMVQFLGQKDNDSSSSSSDDDDSSVTTTDETTTLRKTSFQRRRREKKTRKTSDLSNILPFLRSPMPQRRISLKQSRHRKSLSADLSQFKNSIGNDGIILEELFSMTSPKSIQSPWQTKPTIPKPPTIRSSSFINEKKPLLNYNNNNQQRSSSSFTYLKRLSNNNKTEQSNRNCQIATIFLMDYLQARPPSLSEKIHQIHSKCLFYHKIKYSQIWTILLTLASFGLFLASCFEGQQVITAFTLNTISILILNLDLYFSRQIQPTTTTSIWDTPLIILSITLLTEMLIIIILLLQNNNNHRLFLLSSTFKPIAIFYSSHKARDALKALGRIASIVSRVLVVEVFVILSFAAVACRLYSDNESFQNLSTSWLSLFQLSTTVVNPSMWMPIYKTNGGSAFFFILFVTTSTFYLHSLVLSVVFQTYIQATTEIHERSLTDREDAIRLAFLALQDHQDNQQSLARVSTIEKVLRNVRPHYNAMKIHALVEIMNPNNQSHMDYITFRTQIRQALNASIRSSPSRTTFALIVEILAAVVAVINFIYVILLTSDDFHQAQWFNDITFPAGFIITLLGILELLARFNPFHILPYYIPATRLNTTFDGLALLAAIVSFYGIFVVVSTTTEQRLELLLTGRAIDLIRIMRFFRIFRDVVRRSSVVFPVLVGPLALVISTNHLFVYLGMSLWGGAVEVGAHDGLITQYYDLNNFNTYWQGLLTIFQVLVVNDWHAIAQVFLYASSNSSPYIVYPYFVGANLICVSIMLNCLTAFFVGAFVTKLDTDIEDQEEVITTKQRKRDFSIDSSSRSLRKISSHKSFSEFSNGSGSAGGEIVEFDVYERVSFDKIMRTVSRGDDENDDEFAQQICKLLELYEDLSPNRSKVGYMVCSQHSLNRYGNKRFQTMTEGFIEETKLHTIIGEMHAELLSLVVDGEPSVRREFRSGVQTLSINATLARGQSGISIFVSQIF